MAKTQKSKIPQLASTAERLQNMGNYMLILSDRIVEGNNGRPLEEHEKDLIKISTVPIIKEHFREIMSMYLQGETPSVEQLDHLLHEII